jgi:branched-chain amino acid transport system ATP-binding protein
MDNEGARALDVQNLSVGYGDVTAVWDMSLALRRGTICALVGRNGAGKSSFLKGIAGLLPAKQGTVVMGGTDLTTVRPHKRAKAGLAFVPEGKRVFRDMTVRDNLLIGAYNDRTGTSPQDLVDAMLDRFQALADKRREFAGSLSGGQQQLLAIAQALISDPQVLLLDEPSSGLAPLIAREIEELIQSLRDEGMSIVLVEQVMENVLRGLADDVVLVERGRVTMAARAADVDLQQLVAATALG